MPKIVVFCDASRCLKLLETENMLKSTQKPCSLWDTMGILEIFWFLTNFGPFLAKKCRLFEIFKKISNNFDLKFDFLILKSYFIMSKASLNASRPISNVFHSKKSIFKTFLINVVMPKNYPCQITVYTGKQTIVSDCTWDQSRHVVGTHK